MANDAAKQFNAVVDTLREAQVKAVDVKDLGEIRPQTTYEMAGGDLKVMMELEALKAERQNPRNLEQKSELETQNPMKGLLEKSGVKLKLDGVSFAGDVGDKEVVVPQRNDEAVQFQQEKKAKAAEQDGPG